VLRLNRESNNKKENKPKKNLLMINMMSRKLLRTRMLDSSVIPKKTQNIKEQLEEEKDRCLRLNAEFENQRKRLQKEKENS